MNNSVTASGMAVTAKNSSGSLLIGTWVSNQGTQDAPTTASLRTAHTTSVNFGGAVEQLMPAQHATISSGDFISQYNNAGSWSYKIADAANNYASSTGATTLSGLAGYVKVYDLWICIEAGSNTMENLKANVTIQADGTTAEVRHATRVVVATATAAEEYYNVHREGADTTDTEAHSIGTNVLCTTINESTLVPVKVFVYIDGEDNAVFTNNALNLTNTTISIEFVATPVSN